MLQVEDVSKTFTLRAGRLFASPRTVRAVSHVSLTLRGGLDLTLDDYEADGATYGDPEDPDVIAYNSLFPSRTDSVAGAWADVIWKLGPRVELTPGVRLDLYQSNGAHAVGVARFAPEADVGHA